MSETYPRGGQIERAGGFILACSAVLAAVLVIAGLIYATGTSERTQSALAAAGCAPSLSPSGLACTTKQMLASQYTAIATPADQQLAADAAAYTANKARNLTVAEAALTAEAATEQAFDKNLATITFTPQVTAIATALIQANQASAKITAEQARSNSLSQLRSFKRRNDAADAAVRNQVNRLRRALDLPPSGAAQTVVSH